MYFPTETVIPNVTSWDYQTLSRPLNFLCLEIWPSKKSEAMGRTKFFDGDILKVEGDWMVGSSNHIAIWLTSLRVISFQGRTMPMLGETLPWAFCDPNGWF